MTFHMMALDEAEITELADKISDACDGEHAVMIMVAISDLFAAIVASHPGMSMDYILSDFNSLVMQRHSGATRAIN